MPADNRMMPYQLPMPIDAQKEIVVPGAVPDDERIWVPQAENVWFRPLCLSASRGYWMNLLRVRRAGVLSRHRHPQPVHGYVIKGRWRYLEHDWVATEGSFVYEPPGEIHTLTVPEDCAEMITFFNILGAMIYLVFNEGYSAGPNDDARADLADEAGHERILGIGEGGEVEGSGPVAEFGDGRGFTAGRPPMGYFEIGGLCCRKRHDNSSGQSCRKATKIHESPPSLKRCRKNLCERNRRRNQPDRKKCSRLRIHRQGAPAHHPSKRFDSDSDPSKGQPNTTFNFILTMLY